MQGAVYVNGEFKRPDEAHLSVFDTGFWFGIAIFDTISAWQGYLFKLDAHVDRLFRSAHAARLPMAQSKREIKEIILATTARSGLRDAYVQCLVTRGVRTDGASLNQLTPTLICYAIPYLWAAGQAAAENGARLIVARTRNLPHLCIDPKIKNTNRFHSYLARLEAFDAGADEVLMLDLDGHVTESRGANVFAVRDGALYTPAEGILAGITRQTVGEIAREAGLAYHEVLMTPYDLYTADEAFLSSTAGGIFPVIELDRRQIGSGRPGPLTTRIRETYWRWHVSGPHATPVPY